MDEPYRYEHKATLCHASSNVCPKVFISEDAPLERQVKITDDFDGEVFISLEQLELLKAAAI